MGSLLGFTEFRVTFRRFHLPDQFYLSHSHQCFLGRCLGCVHALLCSWAWIWLCPSQLCMDAGGEISKVLITDSTARTQHSRHSNLLFKASFSIYCPSSQSSGILWAAVVICQQLFFKCSLTKKEMICCFLSLFFPP